ncbi:MAG: glycosyltransferase family 2 protein [Bacteroidaceae bacterium]|nr:glycosyltransferase family 2 protein [Bacteroidaceae bacterium]
MDHKIGIIIPIFKVEKYIAECVESILAQTYTNFRLILVDDGTPDNAGKICDEYAKKDQRITVIHQENAGVTRARARGVEEASNCEYVMFVDSDDTLPKEALETLLAIITPDSNIALGNIRRYKGIYNAADEKHHSCTNSLRIHYAKHRENMFLGKEAGLWGKLIRRKIITPDIFDIPSKINMGEDVIASTRIAFNNEADVCATECHVYNYRQHDESIMHTFKRNDKYDEMFYDYLWKSVPDRHKAAYEKHLIRRRIMTFDYHFGYSSEIPEWIGSNYHKTLLSDIKRTRYRALPIERLLLTATNKHIRTVLIFIKRCKNKLIGNR